jgi:hypothetical protein
MFRQKIDLSETTVQRQSHPADMNEDNNNPLKDLTPPMPILFKAVTSPAST